MGDDQLRVAGIKIFMDGSISGETADNSLPYPSGKRGVLLTDQTKLKTAIEFAQKHQLQTAIHAMGDAAIQLVLDTTCDLDPWLDDMLQSVSNTLRCLATRCLIRSITPKCGTVSPPSQSFSLQKMNPIAAI